MALEHLLDELRHRVAAEIAEMNRAAEAEASAVTAAAEARVAAARRDALERREAELRAAAERAVATARREARRIELVARHRLLDKAFAAASAMVPGAASAPAYRALLPGQIAEALACLGARPAAVHCTPALAADIRAALPRGAPVTVEPDERCGTGFRLATDDGHLEIDGTLEGRLERDRTALALVAWRALEGAA